MDNREKIKNTYTRKVKRITNIVCKMEKKHGKKPHEKFTYYGGWDMGYYKGLLYAYEQILYDINLYLK